MESSPSWREILASFHPRSGLTSAEPTLDSLPARKGLASEKDKAMKATDSVLAAMRDTNAIFSTEVIGKRNVQALDQLYTVDARTLPPGTEMVKGREAIKTYWAQAIAGQNLTSIKLTTLEAEHLGDGIAEIGRADFTMGNAQTMTVKYLCVWKQEDGRWKWMIDIWNPNA